MSKSCLKEFTAESLSRCGEVHLNWSKTMFNCATLKEQPKNTKCPAADDKLTTLAECVGFEIQHLAESKHNAAMRRAQEQVDTMGNAAEVSRVSADRAALVKEEYEKAVDKATETAKEVDVKAQEAQAREAALKELTAKMDAAQTNQEVADTLKAKQNGY
jgi:hypothetical protein